MKIFYSPASPYVRKVLAVGIELGLADRIEKLPSAAHPVNRDANIVAHNPMGKVPTFFTDSGYALYDSRVICEYLDDLAGGNRMFPKGETRWEALRDQALADGLLDAALLARYEQVVRPAEHKWQPWLDGQMAKITSCVDALQAKVATLEGRVDIGTIAAGCALGYLDFRFPDYDWRKGREALANWFKQFSERPSMRDTVPFDAAAK
ncbi:glutathione S-transferase [uncultured Ferrovibrio sp.]|jgi:glutathione S-transferase|uniref:glutathione S-transferase n=1 Tax=uncultured Ferrovibrio sp. TaxID=1576913 RepID=UPI002610BFAC|nr:glutathione S-transferase [uncultured Ferrovibrio sp.]